MVGFLPGRPTSRHGGDRYAVPASPRNVGTSVSGRRPRSGGSGSYQYQFWLFNGILVPREAVRRDER